MELWALYNEDGTPTGEGRTKNEVLTNGLLHAASHIWIWRRNGSVVEILLQKRAPNKRTWPGLYDISAAGHIDLGESPLNAARREAFEEIGLVVGDGLHFYGVHKQVLTAPDGISIENEFCWLYLLEFNESALELADGEVESLEWKNLENFRSEVLSDASAYVPHGDSYFRLLFDELNQITL